MGITSRKGTWEEEDVQALDADPGLIEQGSSAVRLQNNYCYIE